MSKELKFDFDNKKVIKGYPELRWTGKRPFTSSFYYPAQLKEKYGKPDKDGWMNKIFWGDNLQVMSHMLKDYRGKIDLIYIDPPFDSKADYKKKIKLKGQEVTNDSNSFEEKQYGDIWTNDEYLQFMYERLILLRELLSDKGSIYVHCDYRKSAHLKLILDEIFGEKNLINEIIWQYFMGGKGRKEFAKKHDTIFLYSKSNVYTFNNSRIKRYLDFKPSLIDESINAEVGRDDIGYYSVVATPDVWQIKGVFNMGNEYTAYPTQKPEELLERIIKSSSNNGDIVFDCFMGSGTTLKVANDLNRKFIGADINLGSVQITTKRLSSKLNIIKNGFEVYNVNNYDIFRNPIEAKKLIIEALELQSLDNRNIFDGEKDGRFYKILSINRIASKADLSDLIANLPYKLYDQKLIESPSEPVEKITLVTMGHEPDLKGTLEKELSKYKIDIEIIDLLRSESKLEFKRDSEADIIVNKDYLEIKNFYPMNLLQKLSLESAEIDNWKQLVESIMVDFNFDGNVLNPTVTDIPEKNKYVVGKYKIPAGTKKIKIKITDLISESFEKEIEL
jgi:site-specific DNA-methyltransferase (adenine-specific)